MDWSTLVPTVTGAVLAAGGAFIGQWWSDVRAKNLEREKWARDLRYKAHVDFLTTFDDRFGGVVEARGLGDDQEPPEDYLAALWEQHQLIKLVSEPRTELAAANARMALSTYCFGHGERAFVDANRSAYLAAVRREFGLPRMATDKVA